MILNLIISSNWFLQIAPREFWGTVLLYIFFGAILYISNKRGMGTGYHTKDE